MPLYILQSFSSSTSKNDADAVSLMESLSGVDYVAGVHTFLWLNIDAPCHRHEITDSWFNGDEARVVAQVADAITQVISDSNVLLVSGYAQQVRHDSFFYLVTPLLTFVLHCRPR